METISKIEKLEQALGPTQEAFPRRRFLQGALLSIATIVAGPLLVRLFKQELNQQIIPLLEAEAIAVPPIIMPTVALPRAIAMPSLIGNGMRLYKGRLDKDPLAKPV